MHLRRRYLSPALGQFISRDPTEVFNRYAYVNANPINRVDPSGLLVGFGPGGGGGGSTPKSASGNATGSVAGLLGAGTTRPATAPVDTSNYAPGGGFQSGVVTQIPTRSTGGSSIVAGANAGGNTNRSSNSGATVAPGAGSNQGSNTVVWSSFSPSDQCIDFINSKDAERTVTCRIQSTGNPCPPRWRQQGATHYCTPNDNPTQVYPPVTAWQMFWGQISSSAGATIAEDRVQECAKNWFGCGDSYTDQHPLFFLGELFLFGFAGVTIGTGIAAGIEVGWPLILRIAAGNEVRKLLTHDVATNAFAGAAGYLVGTWLYNQLPDRPDREYDLGQMVKYATYGATVGAFNRMIKASKPSLDGFDPTDPWVRAGFMGIGGAAINIETYLIDNQGKTTLEGGLLTLLAGMSNAVTGQIEGWQGTFLTTVVNTFATSLAYDIEDTIPPN